MKKTTLALFACLLCLLAMPAAAEEAAEVEVTPAPIFQLDQNASPAFVGESDLGVGDLGTVSCSATANCAGGGSVSCSVQGSTNCFYIDNCYAYCNGQFAWCSYRPHPCPV